MEYVDMTTKTPHKHAALIHLWADGAEIEFCDHGIWCTAASAPGWDDGTVYRVKPTTILIGRYEVPAPMRVVPADRTDLFFIAVGGLVFHSYWAATRDHYRYLAAGNCWASREDAELASKAITELLMGVAK